MWAEAAPTGGGERAAGLAEAELTYINLTENNVYYAANHNQGVEHIPGIPKIALSEVQRVVCKWDVRSAKSKKVFILTLKSIWTYSDHSKQWVQKKEKVSTAHKLSFLLASCPSSQHRAVEPHRWGRNIGESFTDWIRCSTLKHFRSSSTFYEIRRLFTVMTGVNPPSYTSTEYEATARRPLAWIGITTDKTGWDSEPGSVQR